MVPKIPNISTKTGDTGQTSLWSGERVSKNHPAMKAESSLDMLDTSIGVMYEYLDDYKELRGSLRKIQTRMRHLKGEVATHPRAWDDFRKRHNPIVKKDVDNLDLWCENIRQNLSDNDYEIKGFVRYGKEGIVSARFDRLRAECRDAEGVLYDLDDAMSNASISSEIKQYINRLSDYFWLLARYTAKNDK